MFAALLLRGYFRSSNSKMCISKGLVFEGKIYLKNQEEFRRRYGYRVWLQISSC